MEDYSVHIGENNSKNSSSNNTSNNNSSRGASSYLYGNNSNSHHHHQLPPPQMMSGFHILDESNRFHHHPIVKMEAGSNNNNNSLQHRFHQYPSNPIINHQQGNNDHHHHHDHNSNNEAAAADAAIKAKIIAHPQYSTLLQAYMDCQKVGAPAEVMARLATVRQEFEARQQQQQASASCGETCKDPELDQFMEAYYNMLVKYREELTRPLQEAMEFMQRIETQLNLLTTGPRNQIFNSGTFS